MFDNVAADYDRLNHLMSLGIDKGWRKKAVKATAGACEVLDIACGTGDLSIGLARAGKKVTGADISEEMMKVMRDKVNREGLQESVTIVKGAAEELPFGDCSFDAATCAFGIRNFEDRDLGLREMYRVLRQGGKVVILELSRPENMLLRKLYDLYFLNILPRIGGKVSGNKSAYNYLPASVVNFPPKDEFLAMMARAGFTSTTHRALSFGICRMFTGKRE